MMNCPTSKVNISLCKCPISPLPEISLHLLNHFTRPWNIQYTSISLPHIFQSLLIVNSWKSCLYSSSTSSFWTLTLVHQSHFCFSFNWNLSLSYTILPLLLSYNISSLSLCHIATLRLPFPLWHCFLVFSSILLLCLITNCCRTLGLNLGHPSCLSP